MRYSILFRPRAAKDIENLPATMQDRILVRIDEMSDDLRGDVKRLKDFEPEYRLRVGDYRVLFSIEGKTVTIHRVLHRRQSYR